MAEATNKNDVVVDTTLEVTLSAKLQSTLGVPGIYAYAVYFDEHDGGSPVWTKLVDDGAVIGGGTSAIPLTETVNDAFEDMKGGKIYVLIQSLPDGSPSDLTTVITEESDISWTSAQTNDFRYDSFEVSLLNSPDDQGNLTSVNGFGLPMQLKVDYNNGSSATAGYQISGADLFGNLDNISAGSVLTYSEGQLKGLPRAGVSPATSVANNLGNYEASQWNDYLAALKAPGTGIVISGFFNGAADANGIWHNAGYYSYELSWDKTNDVFWLDPTSASQIKGRAQFTEADLANSIYSTLGNLGVYADGAATPYQIYQHGASINSNDDPATMNSGENNQWGAMLAQLLTGFTAGYYNTTGKPLNAGVTGAIDLNKNWNWDPTYAFGENLNSSAPIWFDHYSKVFFDYSNSYGSGYSDGLMRQYNEGSPLVSVSEPGGGANVSKISLTIYDDDETPAGYVAPVIYNYIAPEPGGYVAAPSGTNTSGASVGLNLANADMILKDGTPITIDIYMGEDGGAPVWQSVTITPDAGTTLWQNWGISIGEDGKYEVTASNNKTVAGYVLITNFPGMDAGIHWSRITVGSGSEAKTFNLYAETDGTNFLNPKYAGQAGSLAIDGLATISPEASTDQSIPTFTINFLYSATSTLPPDLLEYNYHQSGLQHPTAPVAGTLAGGAFTALDGQSAVAGTQATSASAEVAFGWTGDNSYSGTAAWIAKYTNKIGALNFAQISLTSGGGHAVSPLLATADLDGQWTTGAATLGNGVYTVTMKEYLASDTKQTDLAGVESSALTLTVDVAELGLTAARAGQGLRLDTANGAGRGIDGNWVTISAAGSAPQSGAAVAVVLTNKAGALVHAQTGETGGISVADAMLTTLGGLSLSGGAAALKGTQSVYLPKQLRLGFVSLAAEDGVAEDHVATVTPDSEGGAQVTIGDHVLNVAVDNTLSDAALLANAQRVMGEPLVYVHHGARLAVDLAGESETVNRLGFVRVEVDGTDGTWSVGGVAHGEAGFDAAVRAALDGDFIMRGRNAFDKHDVWTVSGETGFYTPVVLTRAGEVIFAPAENGDAGDGDAMRLLGQNFFAFEDGAGDRDFDDMTVQLTPLGVSVGGWLDGAVWAPLVLEHRAAVREGDRFVSHRPDEGGPGHGLTLRATDDHPARLTVAGKAIFQGAGGIEIDGGAAHVLVRDSGRLVLRGDGEVLSLGDDAAAVTIRNHGLIRGDIGLGAGNDDVRGTGDFEGRVMLRRGADEFAGGAGDDVAGGGRGQDLIRGRGGDDVLRGGIGGDRLEGGRGADKLRGGFGDDVLLGGLGADVFVLQARNGDDRIEDFRVSRDTLDLRALNLDPDLADDLFAAALGETRNGSALLDLTLLGGDGSVRFDGLDMVQAAEITFLL